MIRSSTTAVVILTGERGGSGFDFNRVGNWKTGRHREVRDNAKPDENAS